MWNTVCLDPVRSVEIAKFPTSTVIVEVSEVSVTATTAVRVDVDLVDDSCVDAAAAVPPTEFSADEVLLAMMLENTSAAVVTGGTTVVVIAIIEAVAMLWVVLVLFADAVTVIAP